MGTQTLPLSNAPEKVATALLVLAMTGPLTGAEFEFPNHTITLPEGFTVEKVAGPPLVDRPIVADFDDQGRLYIADSAGVNYDVHQQLKDKPHRIVRLEDTNGDGHFDESVVFADNMMFPEGILWHDGAVYCGAPPAIWKLEDTDGDGVADRRKEWFNGGTLTGCANDIHGPYLGPDGWLYWCKGAFAEQTHERPGRPPISDSAAHIFRMRPDGSGFDSVISGGMDNPVDVTFTPEGEAIFTTTFYSHPGGGRRDGLVHAIYGGVYPKQHGVLDGLTRTGDLLPILTHLGPSAPCGLTTYESDVFGPGYQGNLFSTQFNLRKVQRHVLEKTGATFQSDNIDFLVSDNPDFHPTDVLEDADGSLLVFDTGGWYKICCPTAQLAKPEVLGAVYRIRRTNAEPVKDPRGLNMNWDRLTVAELAALLDDKRPAVRRRAIHLLAEKGRTVVASLKSRLENRSGSALLRRNLVWAFTRIDGPPARDAVRLALHDPDPTVRQAAVHSAGLHRDGKALAALIDILLNSTPHLQRTAATALGQIAHTDAVPALLEAAVEPRERILEHALIYALIQINDPADTEAGLQAEAVHARRAALIALDQMRGHTLSAETVIPALTSDHPLLKETAHWIAGQHPEWGAHLGNHFQQRLAQPNLSGSEHQELQQQLARFASNTAIQQMIAEHWNAESTSVATRISLLKVMAQAGVESIPSQWIDAVHRVLSRSDSDESLLLQAVSTLRAWPDDQIELDKYNEALLKLAGNAQLPDELRLRSLVILAGRKPELTSDLFDFLNAHLDPENPPLHRTWAADVLAQSKLSETQLETLTESIQSAGPLEISKLLEAFQKTQNDRIGQKLVAALKQSRGLKSLRVDQLQPLLDQFSSRVQEQGRTLLQTLNPDLADQQARLEELLSRINDTQGDVNRGQRLFSSPRTACATCHEIGYLGGNLGPDLTRIGAIRTKRDLLEAIVFPNASFVHGFEPMQLVTTNGEQYTGILRQETGDSLLLASGPGVEQRIDRDRVAEIRPGSFSLMPGGLDQQLGTQELADLIAFLKSMR